MDTRELKAIRGQRVDGAAGSGKTLEDWWPNRLRVELLHQHSALSDPMGPEYSYAEAFQSLDLDQLKQDIHELLTDSRDWWPADWGHYGPQMIRMAWHSAGTYRTADGRGGAGGGAQRLAPINSWPDNANIDKSLRLLWPIKKKYGSKISWADLIVLTGNCALESMGFETLGFAGGREDLWEPERDVYWGPETEMEANERYEGDRDLESPLAAVQMGLIYVNPEGPDGRPDPLASAHDIRVTFGRMAMNDEETVALIAGGHAFGKSHGAVPAKNVGPAPEGAELERQGLGWANAAGTGNAEYTITNGIEGAWTSQPTRWDVEYLWNLFNYEWELTESPAGAKQWRPKNGEATDKVPDAHVDGKRHAPMMMTSDLALREDPGYAPIARRFLEHPEELSTAFARAWYKLTHRDMGPRARYLGSDVPDQDFLWQDPIPPVDHELVDAADVAKLKAKILDSGLRVQELVYTAWSSASTYRDSDKRGGANGARIRLDPMRGWEVNRPAELGRVLERLEAVQADFNGAQAGGKRVSLADLIVLAGSAAVEKAAKDAGHDVEVPFTPGRMDASQEQTDVENVSWLEPTADGFRNYLPRNYTVSPEELLVDRANLLTLTAPQMTALIGGLRVLDTNWDGSKHGVFTDRPGALTNDFFVNLLDIRTEWTPTDESRARFEGRDRSTGEARWTATRVDLVFGASSQLRAICEVYGADDGAPRFVSDFARAWAKVMEADRFELGS